MTPITLLTAATSQVCQERGVPFPPEAQAEFSDPHITRVAEVFAELVLAEHAAELEQENRLMRNRLEMVDRALTEWLDKTEWVQK